MDLLELVAVGKYLADQVEIVVEVGLGLAAGAVLPEIDGRRSTEALEGGLLFLVYLVKVHALDVRFEPVLHVFLPEVSLSLFAAVLHVLHPLGVLLIFQFFQHEGVLVLHFLAQIKGVQLELI
jgi:hypothetical protein